MKDFFEDIFRYHHHINQKLADQLAGGSGTLSRSHHLYCHIINAHQIWNARILDRPSVGVNDIHSLEQTLQMDKENLEVTLSILEEVRLEDRIFYENSKGASFSNTIQEILFHVSNHSTHHRGQIIADMRSSGIEPLVTDYIFYKR